MTESGDPLENAIAERVNGILKTEWLNELPAQSLRETFTLISKIIDLYNEQRPHQSISYQTPSMVHASEMKVERKWKNYYPMKEKNENSFNFDSQSELTCQTISGLTTSNSDNVKSF